MHKSAQIKSINNQTFEQLFNDYYSELCHYCVQFVREPELAKEIVQEQFIYLWEKRKTIHITFSAQSYLYTAVKSRSIDYLRSKYAKLKFDNESCILNLPDNSNPAQALEAFELERIIEEALKQLPKKCYTIFSMSRFGQYSNKEIARLLDISIKTVESQMTIAFKKIKKFVEKNWQTIYYTILTLFILQT